MEPERWKLKVSNWTLIEIKSALFILDQAEKTLKHVTEKADKITARAFAILIVVISLVSTLIGFLIKELSVANAELFFKIFYLIVVFLGILCMCCLLKLVFPRKSMQLGAQPKLLAIESLLMPRDDLNEDERHLALIINQITNVQNKISFNGSQNNTRIKLLEITLTLIVATFLVGIITLIIYSILHQNHKL